MKTRTVHILIAVVAIIAIGFILVTQQQTTPARYVSGTQLATPVATPQPFRATYSSGTSTAAAPATTTSTSTAVKKLVSPSKASSTAQTRPKTISAPSTQPAPPPPTPKENQAMRLEKPYGTRPLSVELVNERTRRALVNILCESQNAYVNPSSGSGVIIDPRGIILTNAHVAQRVLLAQDPKNGVSCVIRTGSPAVGLWRASVLYFPLPWAQEHAADLRKQLARGSGEYDFALLWISSTDGSSPLPSSFPYVPIDERESIGFVDDQVLAASYPAELVGGITTRNSLYAVSSVTTIKNLLTFSKNAVDQISLGGIIAAQGGSSGGAVVNVWGYLIGIISVTTEGTTTAARDLRAITTAHIDRSMRAQTGNSLADFLRDDPQILREAFMRNSQDAIMTLYVNILR